MRIFFKTKTLQKTCSEAKEAIKRLGTKRGLKLQQRMMELQAAATLADISRVPPARCHELKKNRKGATVRRSGTSVPFVIHSC